MDGVLGMMVLRTLRFDFRVRIAGVVQDGGSIYPSAVVDDDIFSSRAYAWCRDGVQWRSSRCDEERSTCPVHFKSSNVSIGCSFGPYSVDIECCLFENCS